MKDEAKKISKNKEKKQAIVAELSEKAQKAKAIVFSNYQGMTHQQIEGLKKSIKKADAELVVAKNTLLLRAVETTGLKANDELKSKFQQPSLTLFAYGDAVLPLKEITKLFKAIKLPEIKFGIFEGQVLAENEVIRLSTLPPRDMLIAQVVGGLKSPLYGLHRALNWNLQKLVMTLNAIQAQKA